MKHSRAVVSVLATVAAWWCGACAPLPPGAAGATGAGGSFADERVLVGGFSVIDAVAVSRRFVYAAGPGGVAVYDRIGERFVPPARDLERELGPLFGRDGFRETYPAQAITAGASGGLVTVMAGDPIEDAVWIGIPGALLSYRPFTGQVQRTMLTGVPQRIVFERGGAGDLLVLSGGQWSRVSRAGIATPSAAPVLSQVFMPPTLGDLLAQYPGLRAQPQLLLRRQSPSRPLEPFQLTAGAASPDRGSEVWLGTSGEGLFRVDPVFGQGAALEYGLLDPSAAALAPAANGVWVAGLGRNQRRGGLTFTTFDLQRWRWISGTISTPLAQVRTYAMTTRGNVGWLGTERGLVRVQLDSTNEMQSYTRLRGLPDDRVFAVAARDDGAWAGTPRGLVFVSDTLGAPGEPVLAEVPVYALQVSGAWLWVGTQRGLMRVPLAGGGMRATVADAPRAPANRDSQLRLPIRALAASDSVLIVATQDAVLQFDPRRDGTPTERLMAFEPPLVGDVMRVAVDAGTIALVGSEGAMLVSRQSGARRVLRAPEITGAVFDVLLHRDYVFFATMHGLLRYRRTTDGLVP